MNSGKIQSTCKLNNLKPTRNKSSIVEPKIASITADTDINASSSSTLMTYFLLFFFILATLSLASSRLVHPRLLPILQALPQYLYA